MMSGRPKRRVTVATLLVVTGALSLFLISCRNEQRLDEQQLDTRKQLAGELRDNHLYGEAVREYEGLLATPGLSDHERANLNYLIARVYFEDVRDYEKAAAYYLRARTYNPEGSFVAEASQNLVASLQKLGNVIDAKRVLDKATNIDHSPASDSDLVVARIAGEPVYKSEVERYLSQLPPEAQKQFLSKKSRTDFVRQYVGMELMYRAALREGYAKDPKIVRQREELTKKLIVDQYVVDKVIPKLSLDTIDVQNYYRAHVSDRYSDKPYDSVKAQVFLDYQQEKAAAAYTDYINQLAASERVEFLDQNW